MKDQTHYAILGVAVDATPGDVVAAFRPLAQRAHPDRGGSIDVWSVIVGAYTCLRNPTRASVYLTGLRVQARTCSACTGVGVQSKVSGPRTKVTVSVCSVCDGTGIKA